MHSGESSAWLSGDAPSRRDPAPTAVVTVALAFPLLFDGRIFRGWLIVGSLTFAVVVGPLAGSPMGARVGAWFRVIGYAGRALAIVPFAVVVRTVLATLAIPTGW